MNNRHLLTLVASLSMALILTACSDDKPAETKAQTQTQQHNPFDHSHDEVVTDVVKHQFEHEFADQCVARETAGSVNPDVDKKRVAADCMCIAQYLMKDLSADEARKFLKERQNAQSLRIKFDAAAYFCLQAKQQPKSPQIFNRR
ncbi:MAG: hypothetical protein KGZ80_05220 [Methylomonas sp.]|nr:hypothetical protein [Methylomonas sp.]PPD19886.1 MAG: hypothetical protein CTY23_10585 [Methylomonas sp.]PPD24833.1 MAG: hypothetical protein CTY22_10435 [Methylomonas sp.]PPD33621.1 MAG: hypothetical protein CTY21_10415 [Methylomonas sp.]PPD39388.1 MAG: hypothetical protein CTY17_08075 [Methylomonas sp.]